MDYDNPYTEQIQAAQGQMAQNLGKPQADKTPQYDYMAKGAKEELTRARDALRYHENEARNQRILISMVEASLKAYEQATNEPQCDEAVEGSGPYGY